MIRTRGPLITADMIRMMLDPTHATLKRTGAWLVLHDGEWGLTVSGGAIGYSVHVLTLATVLELSVREPDRTIHHADTAERLNLMFPNKTMEDNGS